MDFEPGQKDLTEFDPDYCIIHLDQDIAPGGYGWVFPKGDTKVNIGLGVEKSFLDKRNKRLGKKDNVESLMKEYLQRNTAIKNAKLSEEVYRDIRTIIQEYSKFQLEDKMIVWYQEDI